MAEKEETEIFRISFQNNLKASKILIIIIATIVGYHIYAVNNYQYYNFKTLLIFLAVTSPMWGSAIFIHIEYLLLNWNTILKIDKINHKLSYIDNEQKIEADLDEVLKIIKHQTKKTALLGDAYDYYEIFLKNGDILIITSLMAQKLEIPDIEMEIIDRYFPSVYFSDRVFEK